MTGFKFSLLLLALVIFIQVLVFGTAKAEDWQLERQAMIKNHLKARDIDDENVLAAMAQVKRHLFVPEDVKTYAYQDRPLPIGEGQTISQPYIVALMSQLAEVRQGMKILEIGTGSGYQAAILNELGADVFSIEIIETLARRVQQKITDLKLPIQIKHADGYFGWSEHAPFDRILITAAANHIPPPLIKQLKPGGKLILPLGNTRFYQTLTVLTKHKNNEISIKHYGSVRFVPMTGTMLN